jgi:ABC-type antimicrobial peptide transport system permease subunit
VTCRRKEFGIRLALGGQQADIRRLVIKGTSAIVAIGIAGGLAGAVLASLTLSRVAPDAPAVDWPLLFGAASVLVVVTTAAAGIPAWRAARVDPVSTLRSE